MKIAILTPIYPYRTVGNCFTPVVHYFAREWAAQGHEVEVFHITTRYPDALYRFCRLTEKSLVSWLGFLVPTAPHEEFDERIEGILVHHLNCVKVIPHSRVRASRLAQLTERIEAVIGDAVPDVFIAHWDNPQLDLLYRLKQHYHRPTFLTLHSGEQYFRRIYGSSLRPMMQSLDGLGFRSMAAKRHFESLFWPVEHAFYAFSGVSQSIVDMPQRERDGQSVSRLVFVGSLIKRKFPEEIIPAAMRVWGQDNFAVTYVGEGKERGNIVAHYGTMLGDRLTFTGKIERSRIVEHLDRSDIFVMISRTEVFGLVYLEAMSRGCITVASRGEGIDGIIVDGQNGFLCEAGNVEELAAVFERIQQMTPAQRKRISDNAIQTARDFTDQKVAAKYLDAVEQLMR